MKFNSNFQSQSKFLQETNFKTGKTIQKKKTQINEETLTELKEAFLLFDSENTGEIDSRELKAAMKAFSIPTKKREIKEIMNSMGKDYNEGINFNEFTNILAPRMPNKSSHDEVAKIFALFDIDQIGKISFKNFKKIANEIGENISDEELYEMLEEADKDGDGLINFEEFYRVMKQREFIDDSDSD